MPTQCYLWKRLLCHRLTVTEGEPQQDAEVAVSKEQAMSYEEHCAMILSTPVVMERQVTVTNFDDLPFVERTIDELMAFKSWVSYL